jgi:hypothetical protein
MNESVTLYSVNRASWLIIFGSPTQFGAQPRISGTVSNNRIEIASSYVKINVYIRAAPRRFWEAVVRREAYSSEACYQYLPLSDTHVGLDET